MVRVAPSLVIGEATRPRLTQAGARPKVMPMVTGSAVPLPIDTVDLTDGDVSTKLDRALESTGFVQLVGHGLDEGALGSFRRTSDQFFALDSEVKSIFVHDDPAANRGYRAYGSEALSYSLGEPTPPDLFESFNCAPEPLVNHALLQPTPWPDAHVDGFSQAALGVYDQFRGLAMRIDTIIGELLDVTWVADRSTLGPDMLATINYRPGPDGAEEAAPGQQRMGAHSDYTTVTILAADPVPGLQIVGPSGTWVDVIPEPGALLLNVGDLLAIMTNDRWPSTLHRVVPMSAGAAAERRSVAYFHYPDLDVTIEPLVSQLSSGETPHYGRVSVEEHLLAKVVSPKVQVPAAGTTTTAGRLGAERSADYAEKSNQRPATE